MYGRMGEMLAETTLQAPAKFSAHALLLRLRCLCLFQHLEQGLHVSLSEHLRSNCCFSKVCSHTSTLSPNPCSACSLLGPKVFSIYKIRNDPKSPLRPLMRCNGLHTCLVTFALGGDSFWYSYDFVLGPEISGFGRLQ